MKPKTEIDYCVHGEGLRLADVTWRLGFSPTGGYEPTPAPIPPRPPHGFPPWSAESESPGARAAACIPVAERCERAYGAWHFTTSRFIGSGSLLDHALFLLSKLNPVADRVEQILHDPHYMVRLSLWHVGSPSFDLNAEVVRRLAELSQTMGFNCWESHLGECGASESPSSLQ